jgi:hypothetical protein
MAVLLLQKNLKRKVEHSYLFEEPQLGKTVISNPGVYVHYRDNLTPQSLLTINIITTGVCLVISRFVLENCVLSGRFYYLDV